MQQQTKHTTNLPPYLWVGLLHLHNFLVETGLLDEYFAGPRDKRVGHLGESLLILGDWLEVAINSGWLEEEMH